MHGFGGMGFGMGWWWVIGLILIVAIIYAIVRSNGQRNNFSHTDNQKSASSILEERYARGEIDKEEFEAKKRDLRL